MLPTPRKLAHLAEESGFDANVLEKVVRLAELLEGLGAHPVLETSLVLKGGTALNLFFGPPRRLSVDLDFNVVGMEDVREMQAQRPVIEKAVSAVARAQGYGVQLSKDAHANRKFFLSYRRLVDSQQDRVEIDVNFLNRVPLLAGEQRAMWRPDGEGATASLVSWVEIVAGKLVAFLDRAAPRDAWDVARLPELSPETWPPTHLKSVFVAYAGTLPKPLYAYGRTGLERITESDVSRLLHPMLINSERPTAALLRRDAWKVLAPLLEFSELEIEFTARLQKGDLLPDLIFPGAPQIAERLKRHPPLLWKARNARAFAAR